MTPFTLTREQVREFDRRAIQEFGVPNLVLMENAGRGAAELLTRLNPDRKPVVVLCGPGNNGGDGFVVARHLDARGWPVEVGMVHPPGKPGPQRLPLDPKYPVGLPVDADANLQIVRASRLEAFAIHADLHFQSTVLTDILMLRERWVVDAVFGTGLSRPLGPPLDELVGIVNASRNPVLSLDIPSGLDCDTGEPLGPTVRAAHTATFVAPKRGFLNPASREWTGEVHVIDIGAPRALVEEYRNRPAV